MAMSKVDSRTIESGNSEAVSLPKAPIADLIERLANLPPPTSIEIRDIEPPSPASGEGFPP